MKITKDVQTTARRILRLSMVDGVVNETRVRNILQRLQEKQPRHYIELLTAYTRLIKLELAKHTATVQSAIELSAEEKSQITAKIESKYGTDISYVWEVIPALLGGLKIRVGDNVIDGTISSSIERLRNLSKTL